MKQIITPLGIVALSPGTTIDISKNNPLFTRAEEFSISLTVPRLPNEHIFGHKWRLTSAGAIVPIEVQFVFFGREKLSGTIELISGSDESYEILMKGSRSDFIFRYGKIRLPEIDFGWENFVPGNANPLEADMQTEMYNTLNLQRDWICFPVYHTEAGEWINRWSFDTNGFAMDIGGWRTAHVRLYRALERLFAIKGYTVTDNWFSDTDEKKKIVIFNNGRALASQMNIRFLLPDWTITEFINEIEDFFPVTFFINSRNKTVRILSDDTVSASDPVDSLDRFVVGKHKINFNDTQNGYDITYELPADDETTDQNWDYADQATVEEVNTFSDLPDAGVICLVVSEGQYYEYDESDPLVPWKPSGNVALGIRSGEGEISRKTKIYPLLSKTQLQPETVTVIQQYVDIRRVAINFKLVVPHTSKIASKWSQDFRPVIYRGMETPLYSMSDIPSGYVAQINGYPMANYINRKITGARWPGQSIDLCWNGDQGLQGAQAIAFLDGAEKTEVKLLMNHVDLENMDMTKVYILLGRRVLISELTIHYSEGTNVEIDAVLLAQARV
ncbi:MAG TPA: hypothetical protein VFC67_09155 [Prolixibacteraceae bacterium]|nr:hypothetical protein [Prolixibacteraceae bacterium]